MSINLPEDLRQSIFDFRRALEGAGANVGWVKPESLHFTLKFLGEVEEARITEISQATALAVEQFTAFDLAIDESGVFPNWRRPRIVWLGSHSPDPQLQRLSEAIEDAMTELGFPRESRPFQPHLTIGRVRSERRLAELREKIENTLLPSRSFAVRAVCLMWSQLKPSGAEYYPIADFGLRIAE